MAEKTQGRLKFIIDVTYLALVAGIVYLAFKYVMGWVLPFILAFILVSLMHPIISFAGKLFHTQNKMIPILVMALLYIGLGLLIFFLFTQLFFALKSLVARLPEYYEAYLGPTLNSLLSKIPDALRTLPPELQNQALSMQTAATESLRGYILQFSQSMGSWITRLTTRLPSFMITLVFTILLSFSISIQYDKVLAFARKHLPKKTLEIASSMKTIGKETVWKYIKASLTLMSVTFSEVSVGLLFLRTPKAIPIAAGIAVFDALPFVGTGAIVIPWALIELLQGRITYGIGLIILYAIVLVVRNLIEPKVVGDKLGLNPIVSIVSIYLGFRLIGVIGMIIMPIFVQILSELHRRGDISIFHEMSATRHHASPDEKPPDAQ